MVAAPVEELSELPTTREGGVAACADGTTGRSTLSARVSAGSLTALDIAQEHNKVVRIAYDVLKSGSPFDPELVKLLDWQHTI